MVDARRASAAGLHFPAEWEALTRTIDALLAAEAGTVCPLPSVRAIVAPHGMRGVAGAVAAAAWQPVVARSAGLRRVLLLGPAHHASFAGFAAPFADAISTPLGTVLVDRLAIDGARRLAQLVVNDEAHEQEHSLEAQLPFLQTVLPEAAVVPLLVGELPDEQAVEVVDALWDDATLVVVSTDLSRYFDAASASRLDADTARAIEALDAAPLTEERVCGHAGLRALVRVARGRGLRAARVALRHSGEDSGEVDEVVGLGAFVLG